MKTLDQLTSTLEAMGSDVTYHREEAGAVCPCVTPEGFRDPAWHRAHPPGTANPDLNFAPWNGLNPPVCNEQGIQPVVTEFVVKAAVQPATAGTRRLAAERINDLLGDVQRNDHIGIFPVNWNGNTLDFSTFSEAGEDFILYNGRRFIVVQADKIPDVDGDPDHHWEVGLRLVRTDRAL